MARKQLRPFSITAKVTQEITIQVNADSMEDALLIGRSKQPKDFAEPMGDVMDHSLEITSVYGE